MKIEFESFIYPGRTDHEEHEVRLPASQVRLPMNQDRLPTNQARLPVNQVQLPVNQDRLPANQPSESKHNFTKESFLSLLDLNKNASPKSTDGQPIKPYKPKLMACCVCGIAKGKRAFGFNCFV